MDLTPIIIGLISLGSGAGVVALITAISQRSKVRAEAAAISSKTAQSAIDTALAAQTTTMTTMATSLSLIEERYKRQGEELETQDKEIDRLKQARREDGDRIHNLEQQQRRDQEARNQLLVAFAAAIRYINALRLQIETEEGVPSSWPPVLNEWLVNDAQANLVVVPYEVSNPPEPGSDAIKPPEPDDEEIEKKESE